MRLIKTRIVALVFLLVGAMASLGLMFQVGRNQASLLLIVLFTGWVSSPYVVLMVAYVMSNRTQIALNRLMIFLPIASVIFYTGFWSLPGVKPAFVFLMVPLVSWVLLGVTFLVVRRQG